MIHGWMAGIGQDRYLFTYLPSKLATGMHALSDGNFGVFYEGSYGDGCV
jgi:hypothetical protein